MTPKQVTLIEVSPRDGLQSEAVFIQTQDKIEFINLLSDTGVQHIEVTSFVSSKFIPQLQDGIAVFEGIKQRKSVDYSALIPNTQGLELATQAGVKTIALFTAASEQFNQHNIHCSIQDSFARIKPVIQQAKRNKQRIRAYVSCALGCPYEGAISPQQVATVCEDLLALSVDEISLADTIGVGTPKQTIALLEHILPLMGNTQLALHFHDTYGQALANIYAALEQGVTRFDSCVAGLGGCPYAPGASGNVATEDVLYFMHGLGLDTGIDIYKMIQAGVFICKKMGRKNQSKVANAMLAHFNPPT
ncbi:MAG: hydroxymethylglutaryl-CoA lyase [Gammaproteobacteria bacterium]|nr:hydroxymethylglutaryl-CoA lyase [Gammaproteobacteria bacterium]